MAKEKITRAVTLTGDVLKEMADGNLTSRITAEFEPEFDQIKRDTNAVADRLNGIIGQLRQTSRSLKTATGEILAGANDLADRTTRQAATIEQTSASVEQLATTVVENAQRAATASGKANSVAQSAMQGGMVMAEANEAMSEANEAMSAIQTSSAKISNIIGLIDDIGFQTNLLALNASVEAARAGDAGKGFAVVAVEVLRLAQSAAQASSEVKVLIEASANEVTAGSRLVGQVASRLQDILAGAQESSTLIEAIAQANRESSSSLEEVSVAVRLMDEMTQHNGALVEQTNAAIEQTEAQASELDHIVDIFKIEAAVAVSVAKRRAVPPKPRRPALRAVSSAAVAQDWAEF
ncbi:methyl-accepting chemotaxis protein [Devosia psychrophila]|uniref:Methyl-accepting chemotaxis protein n=1 Tax=Devosia psychrophila TaxID=728005 RepID=A0A1I1K2R2_9HYPH|nr:methyl-accepting chemotaxis protein [Devosia psychrophila]SFC51900.1 Methyl-accepting chemotaxis protein [Devosia psychrophila]